MTRASEFVPAPSPLSQTHDAVIADPDEVYCVSLAAVESSASGWSIAEQDLNDALEEALSASGEDLLFEGSHDQGPEDSTIHVNSDAPEYDCIPQDIPEIPDEEEYDSYESSSTVRLEPWSEDMDSKYITPDELDEDSRQQLTAIIEEDESEGYTFNLEDISRLCEEAAAGEEREKLEQSRLTHLERQRTKLLSLPTFPAHKDRSSLFTSALQESERIGMERKDRSVDIKQRIDYAIKVGRWKVPTITIPLLPPGLPLVHRPRKRSRAVLELEEEISVKVHRPRKRVRRESLGKVLGTPQWV